MTEEVQLAAEAVAEVAHVTEATGGLGSLGINLKIFIAQLINFGIVLLVMWKFAYGPIVKLLEERQEKIESGVKSAEKAEKRLIEIEAEQKTILAQARTQASQVLEEARSLSQERKDLMIAKAKDEVASVVTQGKAQLVHEKEQMLRDMRSEIAQMAVSAAQRILAESVDEKTATKLAEGVIDEMTT